MTMGNYIDIARLRYIRRCDRLWRIEQTKRIHSAKYPIVAAGTYKDYAIKATSYRFCIWHPMASNTPMLMRGSYRQLHYKYSLSADGDSPAGWCISVIRRYLRAKKPTSFNRKDHIQKILHPLIYAMLDKHPAAYVSSVYDHIFCDDAPEEPKPYDPPNAHCSAIIGGVKKYLSAEQFRYLAKLHKIVNKFDEIDERRRALFHV